MPTIFRKFHHLYFLIPIIAYGLLYIVLSQTSLNINHDVTLFLEIGNRILDGQIPYVDFYEINFPTIQYLSAIYVLGSRVTGVNVIIVTQIMTWLLIGWSTLSIYFLTRKATDDVHLPYIIPTAIIVYSTALQIPRIGEPLFAQRGHIFLLLFMPFVMIRVQQWGIAINQENSGLRFMYGFIAAVGVAIKPYFAIAPIMIELYGLSQHRDWRRLLRPEIYGFMLFAGLHLLYFLVFADIRNGLLEILSFAQSGYVNYFSVNHPNPFANWLIKDELRDVLFILMVFWIIRYPSQKTCLTIRALCIFALSGVLIFSLQTGFSYHTIIYQTIVWILILVGLARFLHPPHENHNQSYNIIRNPFSYLFILSMLYLFFVYANINIPRHTQFKELTDYQEFILANTSENEGVFVINNTFLNEPNLNFPALYQINRWNTSPYLNHFPFNWGWSTRLSPEEKLDIMPSAIVDQWLGRLESTININNPRLIVIHPDIHFYTEQVGFIEKVILPQYEIIKENLDFIIYLSNES
jgi:hypothetical protein